MNKYLLLITILLLCSCGANTDLFGEADPIFTQEVRSLNGTKLISPEITTANSDLTYQRDQYSLNTQARLLLRLENLSDLSGGVVIDDEKRMYFELTPLPEQDLDEIRDHLKLCPLTKNWMMLATWLNPHPFPGAGGTWDTPGGDFNDSECLIPEEPTADSPEGKVLFDVSDWFTFYNQSRDKNYGWILIPSTNIKVYGDSHISYSPKLIWQIVR